MVSRHTGKTALEESEIGDAEAFALIETSGGNKEHDEAKLEALLEALYSSSSGLISSGTLSQSQDQFETLWSCRELIAEAAGKDGKVYKYDVSVPVGKFKEVADGVRTRLAEEGLLRRGGSDNGVKVKDVLGYGHFGDGALSLILRLFLMLTRNHVR